MSELTTDDLRNAIDIYLTLAYAETSIPPNVMAKIPDPGYLLESVLESGMFELPLKRDEKGRGKYSVRLGNARYPHMKLVVQPNPSNDDWLLAADTHDRHFEIDPDLPGIDEFLALRDYNTDLKQRIEAAWVEAGLPTFETYLKDEVQVTREKLEHEPADGDE